MQNLEENAAVVPEDEAAAEESLPADAAREGDGRPAERSPQLEAAFAQELAEIAGLDPEMTDVRAILRSDAGPKFREYVRKGLTFVEAFRLAAADRLEALRDAKAAEALRGKIGESEKEAGAPRPRRGEGNVPGLFSRRL